MPQFAVFKNPGSRTEIPFVVQVQCTRLERAVGRVVMPLVLRSFGAPPDHALTPWLTVLSRDVFANPLDLATIPARRLGEAVGTLSDPDQQRIIAPSTR